MTGLPSRFGLCLVWVALLGSVVEAQTRKKFRVTVPYEGPEVFARLLDHAGLMPLESIAAFQASPPEKTIAIIFGEPRLLMELDRKGTPAQSGQLSNFLQKGGALFVATDRTFPFDAIGWHNVQVINSDLINSVQNFEGQPECPTITSREIRRPNHPIFAGLTRPIATNCPGSISSDNDAFTTLAYLPVGTTPGLRRNIVEDVAVEFPLPRRYLITAAAEGAPPVLLMAGHGPFMNCMMVRDDIDNRRFALNTIEWLKGNQRTHVLFINEGKIVTRFKMPLTGSPKPPMPPIDMVNRVVDAFERTDIIDRIADRIVGPENALRALLLLGTFGLLLYGSKKYFQRRWSLEATPAIVGVPPPIAPPLIKRQIREMALRDQLGEPAQALARDWFRTYAKIEFAGNQAQPKLNFEVRASLLQRRKLGKQIESLWKLATNPPPADWDAQKLRSLAISLEELSLSAAGGEVVFTA